MNALATIEIQVPQTAAPDRRGMFKPSLGLQADMTRAAAMSAAWDEMADSAFTDDARYCAAKARFDALLAGSC